MKTHRITGGGGTQLHLVETGNPTGRPILFIHGFSQCGLAWSRQVNSDLADDDVNAAIQALGLDHTVLCGWSYGPLVILDYIRHYGEGAISGIHIVGGITKLGSEDALSVLSPEFLSLVPGFFSENVEESVRSLESLLRLCFVQEPSAEELYSMLGYNVSVPPYVRQALLSRSFDNDDLLPKIRKPVLVTHGAKDAAVKPGAAEQHKARIAHAEVHMMSNAGHAPFWDDAAGFNKRLRTFCQSLQNQSTAAI
jgi:non-heme chloroperoxidase